MKPIVCKFGGTSLASASQVSKTLQIIQQDCRRTHVVVSAPGKRFPGDTKVTDLLYQWYEHLEKQESLEDEKIERHIKDRYKEIITGLAIEFDLESEFKEIKEGYKQALFPKCYILSRGEYLCAKIVAKALDWKFVDAKDCILITPDSASADNVAFEKLSGKNIVIPGFYGASSFGHIKTFSRGGSDITGALIARALEAERYENWTDVPGILTADPRIVPDAKTVTRITYEELREMAYMGAEVFHAEATIPVHSKEIPTQILCVNDPSHKGTQITSRALYKHPALIGVTGCKNFVSITLKKNLMNTECGFALSVLQVLKDNDISVEHMPGGIDVLSVIFKKPDDLVLVKIKEALQTQCSPESITIKHLALIAVVGSATSSISTLSKILGKLAEDEIMVPMVNQGAGGVSIILGVHEEDFEKAIGAIHSAFKW